MLTIGNDIGQITKNNDVLGLENGITWSVKHVLNLIGRVMRRKTLINMKRVGIIKLKKKDIKSLEDMVNEHRGRAKLSRHNYYRRRAKAVEPQYVKKGYLSMTIDAAGAQAANYSPSYSTTKKGKPARHHMLKIKSTYVKAHILVLL